MKTLNSKYLVYYIFLTLVFKEVVSSNRTLIGLPDNQFFMVFVFIFCILFSIKYKAYFFRKDIIIKIYSLTIIYVFFNIIFRFNNIPDIVSFPYRFRKGIYLPYVLLIYIIILMLFVVFDLSKRIIMTKRLQILFEVFNMHNLFVIILYLLFVLNINTICIGVDMGYGYPRGFGFVTEPSLSSVISIMSIIYFYKKSGKKFVVSVLALVLSKSGTGVLISIILMFVYAFQYMKKKSLFLMIVFCIFFLWNYGSSIFSYSRSFTRIVESVKYISQRGNSMESDVHNPRLYNTIEAVSTISHLSLTEFLFGRGVGSTIYFMGDVKGTVNLYLLQMMLEGGVVLLMLHFIFLIVLYKRISKNKKYLFIQMSIHLYWFINGGAFFYQFYLLGALFYFSISQRSSYVVFARESRVSFNVSY